MAFVIGGRVRLVVDDAPYTGAEAEVDVIASWALAQLVAHRASTFLSAPDTGAELVALKTLHEDWATHARPTWNLVDALGPVPVGVAGIYRTPVPLLLAFVDLWASTFDGDGGPQAEPDDPAPIIPDPTPTAPAAPAAAMVAKPRRRTPAVAIPQPEV